MRVAILVPAFNEGPELRALLAGLEVAARKYERLAVFLVDDGSEVPIDAATLPRTAASFELVLARHFVNLGQGAALETARQLALRAGRFDAYVTVDADGQHSVEDLEKLVRAVAEGADVVFGNRFAGSRVPVIRRSLLRLAAMFEWALTGLLLGDAHNGYRALSPRAIESLDIEQNQMAHATEIKQKVRRVRPLVVREVPVVVTYSGQSLRKGQSSWGALPILRDLAHAFLFGSPS